jgi:phosphatidylethanolamine/phosphatidyl-N-methylethanolamine N-methyltransferase
MCAAEQQTEQQTSKRRPSEIGLFFAEFLRNFHTTGAVLPSGRFLGRALARFVGDGQPGPRRILEVGPGTGAVTKHIVAKLRPQDRLDLVELNDSFVERLRHRFETDPSFDAAGDRWQIFHCPVQDISREEPYDLIISGLPLNNFSVADVGEIIDTMVSLLKPGGTLSFFEYIAVRGMRSMVGRRAERERMRGISRALQAVLDEHEIRRDWIWPNVLPAWVHHVQIG